LFGFKISMIKFSKLKSYLTTPSKCYIQKCKARCCVNAPLPDGFLEKNKESIQRQIFSGVNIGHNNDYDEFESIVYSTRPIIYMGTDKNGKSLVGIPKEILDRLNLKNLHEVEAFVKSYDDVLNYCPFINIYGRCSVYSRRPKICRDFGTLTDKLDICPEKVTPLEVYKGTLKTMLHILKHLPEYMYSDIKLLSQKVKVLCRKTDKI